MKFVLRIMGGLGNQLFQYGMMRYLNLKYPESKMYIDARNYEKYKIRDFELKSFKLYDKVSDYNHNSFMANVTRKTYHTYQYLFRRAKHYYASMLGDFFQRRGLLYATIDYTMPTGLNNNMTYYLYGYFGKWDYLNQIKDKLKSDIQLKEPFTENAQRFYESIQSSINAVGVSVRYGQDYQSLGWPICTPDYYKSGMDKLIKERGECKFFIFSDAIDEVISNKWFEGYDCTYVKGCSVVEGFSLLKECSDFVVANSSFSLWSAWLADNPQKIVYAPNYFYSEVFRHRYDELIVFDEERFLDYKTGEETNKPIFEE